MSAPWAAPDTTAAQPRRPDAEGVALSGAVEPAGSAAPALAALPPPPLALRPMTMPDLMDGSFAILRRRPRDVLLIAAAFVLPVQLLSSILLRDVLSAGGFGGTGIGDPTSSVGVEESGEVTGVGASLLSILLSICSLALLAGALGLLVADWYEGRREPPGRTVLRTLRRAPALLVGVVVVHVLEVVGLLGLGVGAYVAMAMLHVVSPVITMEGLGPFRAVARSVRLCGAKFWRSIAVPALVAVVGTAVGFGFQVLPELVTLVVSDDWNWLVRSAGGMLTQLLVAPFTAGVAVLYLLDLKVRAEGDDIARRVRQMGPEGGGAR